MKNKKFSRRGLVISLLLTLVFASLAITLPSFAQSNQFSSMVSEVFSSGAKTEESSNTATAENDAPSVDSKTAVVAPSQSLLSAAQPCNVLDNFNRADSTDMGPNWTESPGGDLAISNNRAVRVLDGSSMKFNGTAPSDKACADVYSGGAAGQYGGLYLKFAAHEDNLFVKVQDNDSNGNFERIFFQYDSAFIYNQACQGGFSISSPFTSARLTVYLDGTTLKADIDTNFDNITDQSYSCSDAPAKSGTSVGLRAFGPTQLDNFGIPPSTLTVTKTADTNDGVCDADCSLREAIAAAQAGDTIAFSSLFNSAQTITLSLGELFINKNLTVNGTGANLLAISGNNASRVFRFENSTAAISGLTIRNGSADNGGGIISNNSTLTVTNCSVSGNATSGNAGGIYNIGGTLNLVNSTVAGNTATGIGGGIANGGIPSTLNVTNSTISGNASNNSGGGIFTNGAVTIRSSTVTANRAVNQGGGIANFTTQAVTLGNTIIAGNTAASAPDFRDALTSDGWNLIGNTSGTNIQGTTTGNVLNQDARLLPLAGYGGTTQTHALLPDSPAINAGTATNAPAADQRGKARVGAVDIGSFEAPANLVVTNTLNSGAGSLRDAIAAANASAADESISFQIPPSDTGCTNGVCTITLTSGVLTVDSSATAGILIISNSTGAENLRVSGNNQSGIIQGNGSSLALQGLTVRDGGNVGVLQTGGSLTILNSTITDNVSNDSIGGAGIVTTNVALTIFNSTVSNNTRVNSTGGGIFISGGSAIITNTTISGNAASVGIAGNGGAGVAITGINPTVTITNSTISNNRTNFRAGGVRVFQGTLILRNTIISGNTAVTANPDILRDNTATVISNGNNLIGDTSSFNPITWQGSDILNQPPRVAPLGFYGEQTMTHALLNNSPAINAGTSVNAPLTDQRGAGRVGNVDIGAFELNNSANGGNFKAVLPKGTQNVTYNFVITPNNGAINYTLTSGNLPNGVNLTTNIAPNAVVSLAGTPTQTGTFNFSLTASDGVNTNVTDYQMEVLAPTSAGVSISGRVMTSDGIGIRNTIVMLTLPTGEVIQTRSSTFGYFRFDDIEAGQTVVVNVEAKRFQFAPIVLQVQEDISELNFTAFPQ